MDFCPFCRVVDGRLPADMVYQDEYVVAFNDINPKAPIHILVIPRQHVETLNEVSESHGGLMDRMYGAARRIAEEQGFAERGYRTVINCNRDAGQTVYHLHLHVLAGRLMSWPPG